MGVASPVSTSFISSHMEASLDGTHSYVLVPDSSVEVIALTQQDVLTCNFEADNEEACPYMLLSGNFNWTRHSGQTPTNDTGPFAAMDGDHYIYLESSAPRVAGDIARYEKYR